MMSCGVLQPHDQVRNDATCIPDRPRPNKTATLLQAPKTDLRAAGAWNCGQDWVLAPGSANGSMLQLRTCEPSLTLWSWLDGMCRGRIAWISHTEMCRPEI